MIYTVIYRIVMSVFVIEITVPFALELVNVKLTVETAIGVLSKV